MWQSDCDRFNSFKWKIQHKYNTFIVINRFSLFGTFYRPKQHKAVYLEVFDDYYLILTNQWTGSSNLLIICCQIDYWIIYSQFILEDKTGLKYLFLMQSQKNRKPNPRWVMSHYLWLITNEGFLNGIFLTNNQ
jgi:hypothetical protein